MLVTEPVAVAVDAEGNPKAFGSRAVLLAARRGSGLRVRLPFTSLGIDDPALGCAYLRWLIETGGRGRRHTQLMVVVPALAGPRMAGSWRRLGKAVGADALVVERPLAALAGLGIDVSSGSAYMVVDSERDATEVAVVAEGAVVDARHTPPLSAGVEATAEAVLSLLVSIDPDFELDIADRGIQLVGRQGLGRDAAADLASRVGFPVVAAVSPERVVIAGAQRTIEEVRPYLHQLRARSGTGLRAVRGGFAR
jgi:actin-like ATPase involved in cell morphogenesis